jgi:hypothetical protein
VSTRTHAKIQRCHIYDDGAHPTPTPARLERVSNQVSHAGKSVDANDQQLIEKVQTLLNKEEARLRKVSRLLADLQSKYQ